MNKQDNGKTEFFCGSCWIVHKGPQPEALKDDWKIRRIDHKTAASWVVRWHYSRRMPTGKNVNFGAYDPDGQLYAVIVFGTGVNPYQAKYLGVDSVVELKRMCRREPRRDDFYLSRFIRQALRLYCIEQGKPGAVVAFADPAEGHSGGVYKATGFQLHGMTNAEWHLVDADGQARHRRYAYRFAKRHGISAAEARERLGVRRAQTPAKYRWVLKL